MTANKGTSTNKLRDPAYSSLCPHHHCVEVLGLVICVSSHVLDCGLASLFRFDSQKFDKEHDIVTCFTLSFPLLILPSPLFYRHISAHLDMFRHLAHSRKMWECHPPRCSRPCIVVLLFMQHCTFLVCSYRTSWITSCITVRLFLSIRMFAPSAWCLLRIKETTKRKGSFKGNSNREHPLAAEYIWDYRAEATTGSNCNIGDGDYVCKFETVLKSRALLAFSLRHAVFGNMRQFPWPFRIRQTRRQHFQLQS